MFHTSLTLYRAKKHATDQGGKIGHEYTIFKGFSYVPIEAYYRHVY